MDNITEDEPFRGCVITLMVVVLMFLVVWLMWRNGVIHYVLYMIGGLMIGVVGHNTAKGIIRWRRIQRDVKLRLMDIKKRPKDEDGE